jgi:hypothetical protein
MVDINHIKTVLIVETILLILSVIIIVVMLFRKRDGCVMCDCVCPTTKYNKEFDAEAEEAVNRGVCICFRCGCIKNLVIQEKEDEVEIVVVEDEKKEAEKKEAVAKDDDTSCDTRPLVDGKFIREIMKPAKATPKEEEVALTKAMGEEVTPTKEKGEEEAA